MSQGYLTVAFGPEKYRQQAIHLARSLMVHNDELPRAIVTDNPDAPGLTKYFHHIIQWNPLRGSDNWQKTFLYDYSPFEETMFIDADCLVFGSLKPLWKKLAQQDFSVLGSNVSSGKWRFDLEQACQTLSVPDFPKFNGGVYYFRKSELSREVTLLAQQIGKNYRKSLLRAGLNPAKPKVSDEFCFSWAMAEMRIPVIEDYDVREMAGPGQFSEGPVTFEILDGLARCGPKQCYQPKVLHFFLNYDRGFHYLREITKLRLVVDFKLPKAFVKYLVNGLFNPPYFLFTKIYAVNQKRRGIDPIHPMVCQPWSHYFGRLRAKFK